MRLGKAFLVLGLMLALPGLASASSITNSYTFSGSTSSLGVTPFNSSLGTLTSVEVTISGSVFATLSTQGVPLPGGGILGLPYQVTLNQNFTGLPGHSLFDFMSPAAFVFVGLGNGGTQTVSSAFSYSFAFTGLTDQLGFAAVSSSSGIGPVFANGTRSDFVGGAVPMTEVAATSLGSAAGAGVQSFGVNGGVISIEYDYTPNTVPAPEPATLFLLGSGLAGLAFGSRKQRA